MAGSTRKLEDALLRPFHHVVKSPRQLLRRISPAWGRGLLSKQEAFEVLKPFEVYSSLPPPVLLPGINSITGIPFVSSEGDPEKTGRTIRFEPDAVWSIGKGGSVSDLRVISTGSVVLDRKFHLDLDFVPVRGLLRSHRLSMSEDALIACWPHSWGTYYDFVMLIMTKLVRIEHALGPGIWEKARLAYPRRHAPYEREFLQALGVDEGRVIDTQALGGAVGASRIVTANNHALLYPSPDDVRRLRERFSPPTGQGSRRLYISRAGTRRVLNESELRPIMDRFGVEFVEDVPRTLREQIELFGAASLVVGPHGAAFTNIAWMPPGASVLELFHHAYFPPYFYYLAHVLGHRYACWIEPGGAAQGDASRRIRAPRPRYDDLHVDPDGFERLLETAVSRAEC